jgi:tyrosyl-tRNA synthetase
VTAIDYFHELVWRGFEYPQGQTETWPLDDALKKKAVAGYCGFDPTADSLHVGSLLPLMGLVHLQRSENHPVALIGGGTGLIGDPSGKRTERLMADLDVIEANARKIRAQIEPFLANGPHTIVNNVDWLGQLNLVEFLRDIGKHFSVNVMLQRESVSSRMETGISFTEFSYMLLQAYDYLKLYEIHRVNLQIGGSDQWGNILAGVDLIRRVTGDAVHGLTFNLITTASGTKFGKTESGTVWLDPQKTSPYQFYQFWLNVDDSDVVQYLRYFTLLTQHEIQALDAIRQEHPEGREAQRRLAADVTTRVHGLDATRSAERVSAVGFGGDPRALSLDDLLLLKREIPSREVARTDFENIIDLAFVSGSVKSKGEGRRLTQQGGLYLNARRINPNDLSILPTDYLHGRYLIVKKGSRNLTLVEVLD